MLSDSSPCFLPFCIYSDAVMSYSLTPFLLSMTSGPDLHHSDSEHGQQRPLRSCDRSLHATHRPGHSTQPSSSPAQSSDIRTFRSPFPDWCLIVAGCKACVNLSCVILTDRDRYVAARWVHRARPSPGSARPVASWPCRSRREAHRGERHRCRLDSSAGGRRSKRSR